MALVNVCPSCKTRLTYVGLFVLPAMTAIRYDCEQGHAVLVADRQHANNADQLDANAPADPADAVWTVTATRVFGMIALDHVLTLKAATALGAILAAQGVFADAVITSVTRATCRAELAWASTPCVNEATDDDGYCDECRDALAEDADAGRQNDDEATL